MLHAGPFSCRELHDTPAELVVHIHMEGKLFRIIRSEM